MTSLLRLLVSTLNKGILRDPGARRSEMVEKEGEGEREGKRNVGRGGTERIGGLPP